MKRLTAMEVHARKVEELGLDPLAVNLTSTEAIAGALRRLACFLCPCSASTLVRGVVRPLRGLVGDLSAIKEVVGTTLEAMIAHGDFLEEREIGGDPTNWPRTLLYAAPPSFVLRQSRAVIVLGVASGHVSALPVDLEARIEYIKYVRRLTPLPEEDLCGELVQLGFIELPYGRWLRSPHTQTPAQHISDLDVLLDAASWSGYIPGLELLDSKRPVRNYRSRWVEPTSQSGRFVGRRKQAYGQDVWCYVEMEHGLPRRFVDLPMEGSTWRGCDEAWRLQAAIDNVRGTPQVFRLRSGPRDCKAIDFFSPLPMWARRRWDAVGDPLMSVGCLFSYKFGPAEVQEEIRFLKEDLWLAPTS